jgi:hypothetical protein
VKLLQAVCDHGLVVAGVMQLDRNMRGGSVWVFSAIWYVSARQFVRFCARIANSQLL